MLPEEPAIAIEPLERHHLPAALAIQAQAYPPFLVEDERVFLGRMGMTSSFCLAAMREATLVGYILAHGWHHASPPPLGAVLAEAEPPEILFIHDLAVATAGRGLKVGEALVERAFAMARATGLDRAELVAVEGAATYWRRLGFADGTATDAIREALRKYGASARWMTRAIA